MTEDQTRIVAFGNCQAQALASLLTFALPGQYSLQFYSNNTRTGNMKDPDEILSAISSAQFVIFQPLDEKHGVLSADNVRNVATGHAIAFPYLYNDGISGLSHRRQFRSFRQIFGAEMIIELLDRGATAEDAIEAYVEGNLDFRLPSRFRRCIRELQEREAKTDVVVAEHILRNFRTTRQFLCFNHPTTALLTNVCTQLNDLTELPIDVDLLARITDENEAKLPGGRRQSPISPHDAASLGYRFAHDIDWKEVGAEVIQTIKQGFDAEPERVDRKAERTVRAERREATLRARARKRETVQRANARKREAIQQARARKRDAARAAKSEGREAAATVAAAGDSQTVPSEAEAQPSPRAQERETAQRINERKREAIQQARARKRDAARAAKSEGREAAATVAAAGDSQTVPSEAEA